jgi:hypothetical protein
MIDPVKALVDLRQGIEKQSPVAVILKDGFAFVTAGGDVIERTVVAMMPEITAKLHIVKNKDPSPHFPRGKIHFSQAVRLWQSSGKVKKFSCVV